MTITLEMTPEQTKMLGQKAQRRVSRPEQLANEVIDKWLQDLQNAAAARQILANSDPAQRRMLADLCQALGR